MNEREQAISVVNNALPIYDKINELYLTATNLEQQAMVKRALAQQKAARSVKPALYPILTFIAMDILFYISAFLSEIFPVMRTVTALIVPTTIIACITVYKVQKRKAQELAQVDTSEFDDQIVELSDDVVRFIENNQEIINTIPRDYRFYDAVAFFEKVLANGQADSMKEAMNLYDRHTHERTLERNSQLSIERANQQSAMLAQIERNSREMVRNSNMAAVFSIATFLKSEKR